MDGMDGMDGMGMAGGMDSGSVGLFYDENTTIARTYWFIIAAFVGFLGITRLCRWLATEWSVRQMRPKPEAVPSRPRTWWQQIPATLTAISREFTYPQPLFFRGRIATHFSVMPLGRWILLMCYWGMLLGMLWTDVFLQPSDPLYPYYWEKVAFRAAWVSVTQVPLIFCLSAKLNVISILTGISYERLQWFHRWAARTLLLTVIVHWSYFYEEWALADFVQMELDMMPMVKYGFGAWAIVVWTVLTSIGLVRNLCYELFVLQHLAAAGAFLWAIYTHVPAYAQYNVWISISFLAFDWIGRGVWLLYNNIYQAPRGGGKRLALGYEAQLQELPLGFVRVIIEHVPLRWRAGQHIYLSAPTVGIFESHPFTIANTRDEQQTLTLLFKAHAGFTKRMLKHAQGSPAKPLRVFLQGPFGIPPDLRAHETLVFISSGSGAAFTVPLLESVANDPACAHSVSFWWIVRSAHHVQWFRGQIEDSIRKLNEKGIKARAHYVITDSNSAECSMHVKEEEAGQACQCCAGSEKGGSQKTNEATANTTACNCAHVPEQYRTYKCLCPLFATCTRSREGLEMSAFADPEKAQRPECCGTTEYPAPPPNCCAPEPEAESLPACCVPAGEAAEVKAESQAPTSCCAPAAEAAPKTQPPTSCCAPAPEPAPESQPPTSCCTPAPLPGPPTTKPTTTPTAKPASTSSSEYPQAKASSSASSSSSSSSTPRRSTTPAPLPLNISLHVPRSRPAMDTMIRPAVERAWGSTGVVVCGSSPLVAAARTFVATLSDARAVHKGSGAQAIEVWGEKGDW